MSEDRKAENGADSGTNASADNATNASGAAGGGEASGSSESAGGHEGSGGGESAGSPVVKAAETKSVQLTEAERRSASAASMLAFDPADIKPEVRAAAGQSSDAPNDEGEKAGE